MHQETQYNIDLKTINYFANKIPKMNVELVN
jgi:hypothetical protein